MHLREQIIRRAELRSNANKNVLFSTRKNGVYMCGTNVLLKFPFIVEGKRERERNVIPRMIKKISNLMTSLVFSVLSLNGENNRVRKYDSLIILIS